MYSYLSWNIKSMRQTFTLLTKSTAITWLKTYLTWHQNKVPITHIKKKKQLATYVLKIYLSNYHKKKSFHSNVPKLRAIYIHVQIIYIIYE